MTSTPGETSAPRRLVARRLGARRVVAPTLSPAGQREVPHAGPRPLRLPEPVNVTPAELAGIIRRTTVLFLIDDSGSMYGELGDAGGARYALARSVIELMARVGGGSAGVVHWGASAPRALVQPPVDVLRGRRLLDAALTPPAPLGGTDLGAALERAHELIGVPEAGEYSILVLTDDVNAATAPGLPARVAALPTRSVHVLLFDRARRCTAEREAPWRSLPLGSFTRLDRPGRPEQGWRMAEVFYRSRELTLPAFDPAGCEFLL